MPYSKLPWINSNKNVTGVETVIDPTSEFSVAIPRLNGLSVQETIYLNHFSSEHPGDMGVVTLIEFCYHMLAMRLRLADWDGENLVWIGDPLTRDELLCVQEIDGINKMAPINLLRQIFGFFLEEQSHMLGKPEKIRDLLAGLLIGGSSITDLNNISPADSEDSSLVEPTIDKSKTPLNMGKNSKLKGKRDKIEP